MQSLTEALAERGYQLMLGQSRLRRQSREDALLEAIIGRRPDGIVLTGIMHSAEGRKRLLAAGIPVVETWDLTPTPIDMLVGFSHDDVGRAVAAVPARQGPAPAGGRGRQRRARASGARTPSRRRRARARPATTCRVVVVPAPTTLRSGRAALAELLRARRRASMPSSAAPTCSRSACMTEAQARGIAVPERLAVVGFGDLEFAADLHPALTTVRIDGAAIGRQAARSSSTAPRAARSSRASSTSASRSSSATAT